MDTIAFFKATGDAFILFLFPLIGLAIETLLPRRLGYWIIGIAFLLLTPIFTPWHYIIPYVYRTLLLIITAVAFAIFLQSRERKKSKSALSLCLSLALFAGLGLMQLINLFIGKKEIEKTWRIKNYNVEYTANWGFTGQALMTYELNQYGVIPFFVRNVESVIEYDTMKDCTIHFPERKLIFNKCNGSLEKLP
jgi:hypothetical protein